MQVFDDFSAFFLQKFANMGFFLYLCVRFRRIIPDDYLVNGK